LLDFLDCLDCWIFWDRWICFDLFGLLDFLGCWIWLDCWIVGFWDCLDYEEFTFRCKENQEHLVDLDSKVDRISFIQNLVQWFHFRFTVFH